MNIFMNLHNESFNLTKKKVLWLIKYDERNIFQQEKKTSSQWPHETWLLRLNYALTFTHLEDAVIQSNLRCIIIRHGMILRYTTMYHALTLLRWMVS